MSKSDGVRLRHMLDAAREALAFAAGHSRADLDSYRMLTLAILRSLEVVGEAAGRLTDETILGYPQVPWRRIIDLRNRLVHGYDDFDLDRVWLIVSEDLPPLVRQLEAILPAEEP